MPRTIPTLFPPTQRQLAALGDRLRLARLRRRYSAALLARRANLSRATLYRVENGDAGVSLGTYASVLRVLGLHADLDAVGRDDELGRRLQDLELPVRKTSPRRAAADGTSAGPPSARNHPP